MINILNLIASYFIIKLFHRKITTNEIMRYEKLCKNDKILNLSQ